MVPGGKGIECWPEMDYSTLHRVRIRGIRNVGFSENFVHALNE